MTLQDSTEMVSFIPSVNEKNDFIYEYYDYFYKNWLMRKYFFDYVNIKICDAFVLLHSNLFLTMD